MAVSDALALPPLIRTQDALRAGRSRRVLSEAAARGRLVRLRNGVYCDAEEWRSLEGRERHLLRCRAVLETRSSPVVLCNWSAAAVWGVPILGEWPAEVHVMAAPAAGGRSKNGIRRHPAATAVGVAEHRGFHVTVLSRTILDVVMASPFAPAVGSLDWALWRRNPWRVSRDDVRSELLRLNPRYGRRHAEAVLDFGTGLSDSFGESLNRAVMFELGYPVPELQVRFKDRSGEIVVDYFWRDLRIAGEFDGDAKYLRPAFDSHLSPAQLVLREKKREDRLRRLVDGVVRITMQETRNPALLDALLRDAGLTPGPPPRRDRLSLQAPGYQGRAMHKWGRRA